MTCLHAVYECYFRPKDTHRLKERKWKKIFYGTGNQRKAEVTILVSQKISFKKKKEEDMTIVNMYVTSILCVLCIVSRV